MAGVTPPRPPSVHRVLAEPALASAAAVHGHDATVDAIRLEIGRVRQSAETASTSVIADRVAARLAAWDRPSLVGVINATGIVLHTNLGRAPLAESAARAAYAAGRAYSNLEIDLTTGRRSSRQLTVRGRLQRLLGAESAVVVNNCAAATVLALRALAAGREVIVSRGQLVEIGGSYRIPEILAVSGAVLREVGTTNITRPADYERAITPSTAVLLRVHASNYRVRGFAKTPGIAELAALGRKHSLAVIDDIGSGAVVDPARFGFAGEPLAAASLKAGADLVLFSGDKLLGGPQAGIAAGREELVRRLERDPLMRALRPDKMTLAALDETLRLSATPERATVSIPTLTMLAVPFAVLRQRAEALAEALSRLPGVTAVARRSRGYAGGGTLPDQPVRTAVVAVRHESIREGELARRLRTGTPAVLVRVRRGEVVIDVRTVFVEQDAAVVGAIRAAVEPGERGT